VARAKALYSTFVKGKLHESNLITAECSKLMENTYRDVNIALANEFSIIAEELQFDVLKAIQLANYHPRVNILNPGIGVGGHCIAIDPWFLIEDVKHSKLISAARELNESMPRRTTDRIERRIPKATKRLGLLGVSYKPNVDDARETPALEVAKVLLKKNYEIRCQDPYVKAWDLPLFSLEDVEQWAEILIILSEHDVYRDLKSRHPILHLRDILGSGNL
jgi:UDP-N-acetylglucosamine 2-epimerase (non-hydrolysing)